MTIKSYNVKIFIVKEKTLSSEFKDKNSYQSCFFAICFDKNKIKTAKQSFVLSLAVYKLLEVSLNFII